MSLSNIRTNLELGREISGHPMPTDKHHTAKVKHLKISLKVLDYSLNVFKLSKYFQILSKKKSAGTVK